MVRRALVMCLSLCGCSSEEPAAKPALDSEVPADTLGIDTIVADTADSAAPDTTAVADSTAPDTIVAEADVDAGDPCAAPLACPTPTESDKAQLCGRLFDVVDTARIAGTSAAALQLTAFDALDLAATGAGAAPLAGSLAIDSCGRFSAAVKKPTLGFFALAVDDKSGGTDAHVVSAIAFPSAAKVDNLRAFAIRKTTDAAWSTAAGITSTFAARGAAMFIFVDPAATPIEPFAGAPASGVTVTRAGSTRRATTTSPTAPRSRARRSTPR